MPPAGRHETTVSGTLEGVIAAAEWVHDVARQEGLAPDIAYGVEVCLEELLTNLARHGGATADVPPGQLPTARLALTFSGEAVELVVEDDGRAFDISAAPAHAVRQALSETPIGGLGLRLVRSFSHDLSYERRDGKNRVTLHFLPAGQTGTKAYR